MENLCGVCFTQGELYILSGFHVPPMCLKCTKSFNAKAAQNIHQNRTLHQPSMDQPHQQQRMPNGVHQHPIDHQSHQPQHPQSHQQQNQEHQDSSSFAATTTISTAEEAVSNLVSAEAKRSNNQSHVPIPSNTEHLPTYTGEQIDLTNKLGQSMHENSHLTRTPSADRKFICSFCQKGFTQAANLRNHERIHRNERPFVCSECGKAFTQVTNLNNHRRLHTGERPFVCNEATCGRAFAQVTNLNNHMKTHHKIQQFVCHLCPKKFTQVTTLNQHLLVHSGVRGFACPECPDKAFKQQSHLNQHMKTHGAFSCGQCDEKFGKVAHLTQHMKTHTDLKFKCNICMAPFSKESLLRKHMHRHVDDGFITRLFACAVPQCKQVFPNRDQQLAHIELEHTKPEPSEQPASTAAAAIINCYFEACNQSFESVDRMNEHLIVVHKMLYDDIETRSKMSLMFLEQIKHQMAEQYVSSLGGGQNGDRFAVAPFTQGTGMQANFGQHQQSQQHFGYGSNKRTEDNVAVKRHQDNASATAIGHTTSGSYCVCSVCFNVYKNMKTMSRHMLRFHGVSPQ